MRYDVIIAGSGFSGSIIARDLAEAGVRVLVVEKRGHIAGNMYDEVEENGILVQRYGPHSFHTNDKHTYDYVCRFTDPVPYRLTYRAVVKGLSVPCPFNFTAIEMLYPPSHADQLISRLRKAFPSKKKAAIFELLESHDKMIQDYAHLLFDEDFRPYTAKQWGRPPEDIDQSVIRRVPVLLDRRDGYFDDLYEFQPAGGYTKLIETLLEHPGITVQTGTDALDFIRLDESGGRVLWENDGRPSIFFTGPLDELFCCRYGQLPYRSLHFEWQTHQTDSYQETAIVAWPKDRDYTRISEFTKLPIQRTNGKTVIAVEYPLPYDKHGKLGNEPYYPVVNEESTRLRDRYLDLAARFTNLTLCGRLADFRYYNMDEVARRALTAARAWKERAGL